MMSGAVGATRVIRVVEEGHRWLGGRRGGESPQSKLSIRCANY